MFRTVTLPVRMTYGVGRVSARAGYSAGRRSARATYRATRLLGIKRMIVFGLGVGVGLLIAPVPGVEMRERLRRKWEEYREPLPEAELAEQARQDERNLAMTPGGNGLT
jgi:hypothetical protein